MPLYYKNQGTWETVDSPYIKQNGEWIEPEQAYIKENGEWKLVFEQFSFDVTTKAPEKTTRNLVLKGQLNEFEGFVGERSEFFKTVFFKETELTNSTTGDAVAIDKNRGLVATGGANDTVYIYNQNLSVINGSNVSETKNFESPEVVPEPDSQINSLSFYELGEALAVAADKLYIFEDGFGEAVSFEVDEADGTLFTDLDFYEDSGILAAGTEFGGVYVFSKDASDNWQRDNKINDPISGTVTSVAFSQYNGTLAVGNDQGEVYVYEGTTNGDYNDTIESFNQTTSVAFSRENEKLAVADFDGKVAVYSNGLVEEDSFNNTSETTSDSKGGVAWDDSGLLAHASADSNLYIYEKKEATYKNVKTFEEAEKPYQTVVWDGTNEIIIGGTNEEQSGTFHVFSTGVQMSFRWGENGTGFPYNRRVTGFASSGKTFESRVIGLEPNTQYEFQAQGEAANGRLSNGETKTVNTPNIVVETASPDKGDVDTFSATIGGSLDTNNGADVDGSYIGAIQYKKDTRTTWNNEKEAGIVNTDSSFTVVIDELKAQQTYDVRAKATYEGTVAFGEPEEITTEKVKAAFVEKNLDFGNVFTSSPAGSNQETLEANLEETSGGGQYQVNNVKIEGVNSTSFSVDKSIEGKAVPQDPEASPRTRSFDVTFNPSFRLDKDAEVVVEHTAPYGENPLTLPIKGTGEEPTTIEAEGVSFTTTVGEEERNEVKIVETGKDYGATITDVREAQDSEQPAGTVPAEWDLKENSSPLPSELQNGNNYNLPPGGSFEFNVGWNPTDGNDTQIFYIQIEYEADGGRSGPQQLRVPVEGNTEGTVDVNVDPERNGEIIDASSEVYDFGSEITKRTNREPNPSVTDENVTVVRDFQLVGDPASAGSSGSPYEVQHMRIEGNNPGDVPGDFAILNAPSDATDESSGTSVEMKESDTLTFQLEFDPSDYQNNPIEAQLAIYAANADNSAEFENDGRYLLDLQGEGLQPGEIATENANNPSADEPYQVGTSIAGGNPLPNEGTLPITVTNISPDRDVLIRSDSIENAYNNDFRVESSIDGDLIGQSPETIGESTDAEVEIRPTVKRSNEQGADNKGYIDGETIGPANYKIFNDADFGPDPVNVEIEGTFQVTSVIFLGGTRTEGSSFDPETSVFEIVAGPGTVSTKTLTVQINKGDNSVSTNAVINDPQQNPSPEESPIFLAPDGSDGTAEGVLDVNGGNGTGSKDPDFLSADVRFAPQSDTSFPATQQILVEWDNKNESQNVTIKGIAGSTINVFAENVDTGVSEVFSGTDSFIDYGNITENETRDVTLVVEETSGSRPFDIQSDLSGSDLPGDIGQFSISNNGITSGTTLQKDTTTPSVNADVAATPNDGAGGSSYSAQIEFEHNADNPEQAYLEDPVQIDLSANVLNKAEIELNDVNTGGTPVKLKARIGDSGTETIELNEVGADNDANITGYTYTSNPDGVFGTKNEFTDVVAAGTSTEKDVPQFNPVQGTGSQPDFEVDGTLQVQYQGPGTGGGSSSTITVRGEVLRPPTADISSGTDTPLVLTDSNGNSVFYEEEVSESSFQTDGALDDGVIATAEYTVVENNKKNGFTIQEVDVYGDTDVDSTPFNSEDQTTYNNVIDADGNNTVSVSGGGFVTGTIAFNPTDSQFIGTPNDKTRRNTELRIQHDAFQEGPEDGSGGSKKADDPNSSIQFIPTDTSASQILAVPLSVEVRGEQVPSDWQDITTSYNSNNESDGSVQVPYDEFPKNSVDLFIQSSNTGITQGEVSSVSFGPSQDEISSFGQIGGGQRYAEPNDSYEDNVGSELTLNWSVNSDINGNYPTAFSIRLYAKYPNVTQSEVLANTSELGDNGGNYGTLLATVTVADDGGDGSFQ